MRVAVLGAGIQGVCAALELARRGCDVDLYEREPEPVLQASLWNEGKLHLGFIFANDLPSRTARVMTAGSLHFSAALARWGIDSLEDHLSEPFTYVVHRDSMLGIEHVEAHFDAVTAQYGALAEALDLSYPGANGGPLFERVGAAEASSWYDESHFKAAFRTGERSVDPERIADALRAAASAATRVRFLGERIVTRVERDAAASLTVVSTARGDADPERERYDHVVNALWGNRLRVDAGLGLLPKRPWLHRYKLAVHARPARARPSSPPSTTLMLGPFGDVVNFGSGRMYLSWYPVCRLGACEEVAPHNWGDGVTDELREEVFGATLRELSRVVPEVGGQGLRFEDVHVEGGVIFNWGRGEITDPASELHQRWDIGVRSSGAYHSIDTGKYCMAPLFALAVAERIRPGFK